MNRARPIYIPTQEECDLIRNAAADGAGVEGPNGLVLEPGIRCNIDYPEVDWDINVALVTKAEPLSLEWWTLGDDTDLGAHSTWADFRKHGVTLSDEGLGMLDFYVYKRDEGLMTNIGATFDRYGLLVISETARGYVWVRGKNIRPGELGPFITPELVEMFKAIANKEPA